MIRHLNGPTGSYKGDRLEEVEYRFPARYALRDLARTLQDQVWVQTSRTCTHITSGRRAQRGSMGARSRSMKTMKPIAIDYLKQTSKVQGICERTR